LVQLLDLIFECHGELRRKNSVDYIASELSTKLRSVVLLENIDKVVIPVQNNIPSISLFYHITSQLHFGMVNTFELLVYYHEFEFQLFQISISISVDNLCQLSLNLCLTLFLFLPFNNDILNPKFCRL
jgi:hypothetical protein